MCTCTRIVIQCIYTNTHDCTNHQCGMLCTYYEIRTISHFCCELLATLCGTHPPDSERGGERVGGTVGRNGEERREGGERSHKGSRYLHEQGLVHIVLTITLSG